jgi:hypothetical protein
VFVVVVNDDLFHRRLLDLSTPLFRWGMHVGFYVLSSRLKVMTIDGRRLTMNCSDLLRICVPEELDNGFEQNMLPSNRAR